MLGVATAACDPRERGELAGLRQLDVVDDWAQHRELDIGRERAEDAAVGTTFIACVSVVGESGGW